MSTTNRAALILLPLLFMYKAVGENQVASTGSKDFLLEEIATVFPPLAINSPKRNMQWLGEKGPC